jgi:tetratricopeptide (TPR) repeat protein
LHHVVELPPRAESEALGELRRISPAAGEAAKAFAADARLARVAMVESVLPPIAPVAATTPPPEVARIALRFARQPWSWLAGLLAALTLGWVLRPQPRTDRRDSPWLEGTRDVAAAASGAAAPAGFAEAVARGNDSFSQGKFSAAAVEYKKALGVGPQTVPVLVALGNAYLESDRPRNAVEPLEAAARLDPTSARIQLLLGTAYHSLGRTADATLA